MMNCWSCREARVLEAYGELEDPPVGYREHLESCTDCRADIEEWRELSASYREVSCERRPFSVVPPRRRERWIPAVAAALFCAVVLGTVFSGTARSPVVVIERFADSPTPTHPIPLPAWDADDEAFDREVRDLRNRLRRMERDIQRRNT